MTAKRRHQNDQDRHRDADEAAPEPQPAGEPAPDDAPAGELDGVRSERDDLRARLQRLSADYVNYQKRVQKDIAQAREFANEELIKALLGVLDDMERALEHARENHDEDDPLLKGMQLVHDKALDTLGKFGVEVIHAAGEPFDPDRHSALMEQPTDEVPPQTVVQEVQKGYELKGRTIRPASVIVSRDPETG